MKSFLTSIKAAVAALLVAILALPVAAQTQEVEMTPQLEAALQNYDSYFSLSFDGAIIVKQNYRWGLIDTCGTEIIPCKYDFIGFFKQGLSKVLLDDNYGFINTRGEVVVPLKYDLVQEFEDGFARVGEGDKWGLVNKNGTEIVPCLYDNIDSFYNGLAIVKANDQYGVVNTMGEMVVPCRYENISYFSEDLIRVKSGICYGLINAQGHVVVPCEYNDFDEYDGCFIVIITVGDSYKYGLFSTDGKLILPCEYDYIRPYGNSLAIVLEDVRGKTKYGIVDFSGKFVVPLAYDYIIYTLNDKVAIFQENKAHNSKYGVLNADGQVVANCIYDDINDFSEGLAGARLNGKWGFINQEGKVVVPFVYDQIGSFNNGIAQVITNGKCGTIDSNGTFMFSHVAMVDDIEGLLIGEWDNDRGTRFITILREDDNSNNQVTIIEHGGKKLNAEFGYDEKSNKYILYSNHNGKKKVIYYVDFAHESITGKDGSVYNSNNMCKYKIRDIRFSIDEKQLREFPLVSPPEPYYDYEERPTMISIFREEKSEPVSDEVFKSAATMPSFPGGTGELMKFIAFNIRYPESAKDSYIQGKVIVQFVVEKDGSIGEVKVVRGVDKALDIEAVRLCKTLPKFNPGRNANGDPVRVWFTQPITFKLEGAN